MCNNYADKIFQNGDIITVDDKNPTAEAIAIKEGKIIAVGNYDKVSKFMGDSTEVVDLKGNTLMPGLIDPHTHPEQASFCYNLVDVSAFTFKTKEDVINHIKKAVEITPKGDWIPCFGLDPIRIRDLKKLTIEELDAISTDHPIVVMIQSMHTCFANHKAFEVMGITKDTPNTRDGGYGKYENGELDGMIIEQIALIPFFIAYMQQTMKETPQELAQEQIKRYVKAGITSVFTPGFMQLFPQVNTQQMFKEMLDKDGAPIRMFYEYHTSMIEAGAVDIDNDIKTSSDRFGCFGAKLWYDGSPYTGNMLLEENYLNSELMQDGLGVAPDQAGERTYPIEKFKELIKKYNDADYQISVHTQGDKSTKEVLDAFEEALKSHPRTDARHRLEHCAVLPEKQIERMEKMGISPSFHSNHIRYYGEALRDDILGEERASKLMPANTALKHDLRISFHADSPMYPAEPLALIKTAVTRKTEAGAVIGADEGITVDQAIKGVTLDAAWQMFMDDKIGSLEVGKYADFTILKQNPRKINPDDIDKIEVVETYVEGKKITL